MIVAILNTSLYSRYVYAYGYYIYAGCIGLLVMRELVYGRYEKKRILMIFIGFILSVIALIFAHAALFPMTIIFVVLAGYTDNNTILKTALTVTIVTTSIVVLSCMGGLIENAFYNQFGRVRYALGFRYVLCLPTYFFNIVAIICYLQQEKTKTITLFIFGVISTAIYAATDSRLTYYTTILIVLFVLYYKIKYRIARDPKRISRLWALCVPVFFVSAIFSVYMHIYYNPAIKWHYTLNRILGDRLNIGHRSYLMYGIRFLGNPDIRWIGQSLDVRGVKHEGVVTYVDNLYFNLLQQYGILAFTIIIVVCTIMIYNCYRQNDELLMAILVILALHGLIDGIVQQLQYNTFLHFIYYLCMGNRLRKNRKIDRPHTSIGAEGLIGIMRKALVLNRFRH